MTGPAMLADAALPAAEQADVSHAQDGDTRAFGRLYAAHVGRIHSLARRMIGADLADEATQDAFVRAWEKLGTFRGEAAFGTWLYRVAINVFLERRERIGILRRRFESDERLATRPAPRPSDSGSRLDLERAIDVLPAGARSVFVLHDVEGFKHEEIAEMLGVTSGTTKAQLHRARMILREHLRA